MCAREWCVCVVGDGVGRVGLDLYSHGCSTVYDTRLVINSMYICTHRSVNGFRVFPGRHTSCLCSLLQQRSFPKQQPIYGSSCSHHQGLLCVCLGSGGGGRFVGMCVCVFDFLAHSLKLKLEGYSFLPVHSASLLSMCS